MEKINVELDIDEVDIIGQALSLGILQQLLDRLNELGKDWDYDALAEKTDNLLEKLEG